MSDIWKPWPYQRAGMKWLVEHGAAGLFLDPGLGKTSITLGAIKTLYDVAEVPKRRCFLVVAPLRPAHLVWPPEAAKWRQFEDLRVTVLHGPKKNDIFDAPADVQVINPEGLEWLLERAASMREWPWHGLVIDESTKFKHTNTKRFKLLRPWLSKFHRRWILTGTPAPNGLIDLFGQIYVLDLGAALGRYITHYRRQFFAPTGYGGYTWVPQRGAEARIYERIAPMVLRMSETDYLKLPPAIGNFNNPKTPPTIVRVKLPPKAREVYSTIEELFFAELKSGSITAANAGVRSMKLRQAANGGVYLDKGGDEDADIVRQRNAARRWAFIHSEKADAVAEILDELSGKPALIVYDFHHDLERLRAHPDLKAIPFMGSGNKLTEDKRIEAAWNAGLLPAVFVNAASVAHGLNLQQGGRAVIWHSLTWNWEHYWQVIKRVWRQGQTRKTFFYHIVAEDTVDEVMCAVLRAKGSTERALLDALRAYSHRLPAPVARSGRRAPAPATRPLLKK